MSFHAVLYTNDMEPITVVRIHESLWNRLWNGDHVRLVVPMPINTSQHADFPLRERLKMVEIHGEVFVRRGHKHMFVFTNDDENALLLRSEFLPGQRKDVQHAQRNAFAQGFLHALQVGGAL